MILIHPSSIILVVYGIPVISSSSVILPNVSIIFYIVFYSAQVSYPFEEGDDKIPFATGNW